MSAIRILPYYCAKKEKYCANTEHFFCIIMKEEKEPVQGRWESGGHLI
jgi:hypothetical protein